MKASEQTKPEREAMKLVKLLSTRKCGEAWLTSGHYQSYNSRENVNKVRSTFIAQGDTFPSQSRHPSGNKQANSLQDSVTTTKQTLLTPL